MKPICSLFLAFVLGLCICIRPVSAQQANWQPVDYVKAVADKTLRDVPFRFRSILMKPDPYFRGIKTINFERTYGLGQPGVAYAYSVIRSERTQEVEVEISHNDGLVLWLNGAEIYRSEGDRKVVIREEERETFLERKIRFSIREGDNTLLVKSETKGEEWKVLFRPLFPRVAEGQKQDNEFMKVSIGFIPHVTAEVSALSNWFVMGPFPNPVQGGKRTGLQTAYAPEREFIIGRLYTDGGRQLAWELPKVEILADVIDAHPLWGTLYDWNYHTAGYAWAIRKLGEFSGQQRFIDYMSTYCDFMLDIRPYVGFEKFTLNRPYSRHIHLFDTPLLDFTTAPALPFIYRLLADKDFARRSEYAELVQHTKDYVLKEQVRLEDGTFTRETPFKYTTWVDDMFMGIPFLLHLAEQTTDPAERKRLHDDAANQVFGFHKRLYDPAMNLYSHAHYSERPDVRLPYWSRANGWGIWAVSEVLLHLPKNHPKYKGILEIFRRHVDGLVKHQNPETGFYHNVLNKPESFKETSGTAIFTMAIARGINNGWLNRKTYEPYALKGWQALTTVIREDGHVTDICMGTMCSEDVQYYFERPVVEDDSHGLLGLIFAGIEMQKLVEKKK